MPAQYFKDADASRAIASMQSYATRRQELDKALATFIAPHLPPHATVLDAACGIGHLAHVLRDIEPTVRYHGVDQADFIVEEARSAAPFATFEQANVQDVPERHPDGFDIVLSWKTLSWLEHYDVMLPALVASARKHIFISSLFYDGDIDFQTVVTEHKHIADGLTGRWHYNVYSLPRFLASARALGVREADAIDFQIGIDLPLEDPDAMGTYTKRLEDGSRVQFSGALHMPWKLIRLDL